MGPLHPKDANKQSRKGTYSGEERPNVIGVTAREMRVGSITVEGCPHARQTSKLGAPPTIGALFIWSLPPQMGLAMIVAPVMNCFHARWREKAPPVRRG